MVIVGAAFSGLYAPPWTALAGASSVRDPFRYHDKGTLATIGRAAAVADLRLLKISDWPAWIAWLFVHIFFLIGFRTLFLVLFEWAWAYLTYQRSAPLKAKRRNLRSSASICGQQSCASTGPKISRLFSRR